MKTHCCESGLHDTFITRTDHLTLSTTHGLQGVCGGFVTEDKQKGNAEVVSKPKDKELLSH